jgi:hypothetical protein
MAEVFSVSRLLQGLSNETYDSLSRPQVELFLDFFDEAGSKYKSALEKYVKQLDDKTHIPSEAETSSYNTAKGVVESSTSTAAEKTAARQIVSRYEQYTKDRNDNPWYVSIKEKIPNLYSIIKGTLFRKSIWIPSIQWIDYGIKLPDSANYSINLGYIGSDISTTAVGKLMALQQKFESEVFEPILVNLKKTYKKKVDVFNQRRAAQQSASTDPEKLHAEHRRQQAEDDSFRVLKDDRSGYTVYKTKTSFPTDEMYNAWLPKFKASKEWKEYLKRASKEIEKNYTNELKAAEAARMTELTKDQFHMGKVFEDMDVDSINYDVIQQLKRQEEEFNRILTESKAQLDASLAQNQTKLNDDLQKLRDRLEKEQTGIFDKLDIAIKKNESNAEKRDEQKKIQDKENQEIMDEQRALASLKNYKSCSSSSNQERASRASNTVYEDEDIDDLIENETQRILTGQGVKKKRMSVYQQMMMINKRFIEHNGEGTPHVKTNSARKRLVGGDDMTPIEIAATTFDVAGAVFPPLAIIGAILSIVGIFDSKAREEAERRRREEEERQARIFDTWKDDTIATTISTLEAETDPDIFEERKTEMINNMFDTARGEITQDELDDLIQDIDDAHDKTMAERKEILDQITVNTTDVVYAGQDLIENYNDAMEAQLEKNEKDRDMIMQPFVEALSAKAEQYKTKAEAKDEIAKRQQEYEDLVNQRLMDEYDKIDEEQDEIAELKGYKGCSTNTINMEALRHKAREDIARQQALQREAEAQGVTPEELPANTSTVGTGSGNKQSRAQIVKKIMLEKNMKMIEASKYVKQHGLY